jgi:UDP-glucose 4-epimerase
LLRAVTARDIRRFVLSSSAAVYGDAAPQPIPETQRPDPVHAYGGSKRVIELLLEEAGRTLGLRSIALRYFNAAGASDAHGEVHDPETHLIPRVLRAVRDGAAVPVYGDDWPTPDGTCIRDYVHVLDLADAHARALEALDAGVAGAINLGSGLGHSVREILACAERVTGRPVAARVEPRRPGDPPRLVADVQRAGRELGWRAHQGLDAVVGSAWRWLGSHPRGYADGTGRHGADADLA